MPGPLGGSNSRAAGSSTVSWRAKVNWEAIGAVGEILGAIAVFVTLIYLANQIKQSNNLARFSGTKEIVNQFNKINQMVTTDSELRKVLAKTGDLSADEREQTYNFAMMFCAVWVSAQIAHDNHQLEDAVYAACAKDVEVELDRWPNFRQGVEQWLANYPENAHYPIFRPAVLEADRESNAAV
jgi:hypothetical protein